MNGAIQSAADTATFGAAATSGSAVTVTLDTSPQVSAMTFSSTGSYVLQGSGTNVLTLSATGGVALVTVSAGTQTIAAPLTLASSANFAPASGTQLTLSGAIGGTGGLSLTGAGLLVLSGTNNYTGGTTVSAGTLQGTASSLQGSTDRQRHTGVQSGGGRHLRRNDQRYGDGGQERQRAIDVQFDRRCKLPDRGQPGHARAARRTGRWRSASAFPVAPRCKQPD